MKELADSTKYEIKKLTKQLFNVAMHWGCSDRNPAFNFKIKKPPTRPRVEANFKKIVNILEHEEGRERTMIALAFYAGLREGEIFSRKYQDIDYENNTIAIVDQFTRGEWKEPKNYAGKAKIQVCNELMRILKQWQLQSKGTKRDDYLFPSPRYLDKTINYSGWRRRYLQPFLDKHGLSLTLRDFRQLHDRFIRKATNDLDIIQKQMRHGDIRTTMEYYHSIEDETVREALNNFDDIIRSLKVQGLTEKQA